MAESDRLLTCYMGLHPYRGFESLPLRIFETVFLAVFILQQFGRKIKAVSYPQLGIDRE